MIFATTTGHVDVASPPYKNRSADEWAVRLLKKLSTSEWRRRRRRRAGTCNEAYLLLLSNAGVVLRPYSVGAYPLDDADAGDSFARSDSVRFFGNSCSEKLWSLAGFERLYFRKKKNQQLFGSEWFGLCELTEGECGWEGFKTSRTKLLSNADCVQPGKTYENILYKKYKILMSQQSSAANQAERIESGIDLSRVLCRIIGELEVIQSQR